MSDEIIKKLKAMIVDVENARGPAKHILNDHLANLGQAVWDHGDEIIATLEEKQNRSEESKNESDE